MKKILVTGANGQLGRAIMVALSQKHEVLGTKIENEEIANPDLPLIQMDITNKAEVQSGISQFNPDIIINTAAYTNVDRSEIEKDLSKSINVGGIENLINASSKETKMIHISSDYVFDGENGPYSEEDAVCPTSYYGETKLWGEAAVRKSNLNYLIFRPNVLYQSTTYDQASFFAWVYSSLSNERRINVVTDQTSNPTWVISFVDAIEKCISRDLHGIYHFGSSDYISRFDFAILIADIFQFDPSLISPILTKDLKQLAPRPRHSGLKTDKICQELNIVLPSVEECLKRIKKIISHDNN